MVQTRKFVNGMYNFDGHGTGLAFRRVYTEHDHEREREREREREHERERSVLNELRNYTCMNSFIPKTTKNAAGNWFLRKVAEIAFRVNFRRWSHEQFLVNQSVLFSCNSAQVTRGTRKKI